MWSNKTLFTKTAGEVISKWTKNYQVCKQEYFFHWIIYLNSIPKMWTHVFLLNYLWLNFALTLGEDKKEFKSCGIWLRKIIYWVLSGKKGNSIPLVHDLDMEFAQPWPKQWRRQQLRGRPQKKTQWSYFCGYCCVWNGMPVLETGQLRLKKGVSERSQWRRPQGREWEE